MAQLELKVRSNTDALSAQRLHDAMVALVRDVTDESEMFLHADRVGHSRSGLSAAHVEAEVHEGGGVVQGKVGMTRVTEKDVRPTGGQYRHSDAPMFVDGGTRSPIFAAKGGLMWNRSEGIFARKTVRGQTGQHFMAKTYAEAQLLVRSNRQIANAFKEMAAEAAVMRLGMEF